MIAAAAGFVFGYVAHGISTGNWGWQAVAAGGMGALTSWLGYNTMGGSAAMSGMQFAKNQGINTLLSFVTPSINIPISDNFNLSLSPVAMFSMLGSGPDFRFGVGVTASYKIGDWTLSAGTDFLRAGGRTGFGTLYGGFSYDDGTNGFSFYGTKYLYGAKQASGILSLHSGDFSVNFEDDLFGVVQGAGKQDRYRTAALEVGYKNYYLGTQVITNDPKGEGSDKENFTKNKNKRWESGYQFTSALYASYKNKNSVARIGLNSPLGGYLGQNWWHRNVFPTPDYKYAWDNNRPFYQVGSNQFYTLY